MAARQRVHRPGLGSKSEGSLVLPQAGCGGKGASLARPIKPEPELHLGGGALVEELKDCGGGSQEVEWEAAVMQRSGGLPSARGCPIRNSAATAASLDGAGGC